MAVIGPFIENGINPHLLKEYDLDIQMAVKVKSVIRAETQLGVFAVKKSLISFNQAERMKEIIDYLTKNNFPVTSIIPNKYGEYFIPLTDGLFYVAKWIEGKEITLNHNPHLLKIISSLAEMHKLGFFFNPKDVHYRYVDEIYLRKSWQERIDWLKKYNKSLKKKANITTFEHIFSTYIPFLIDWAEEAVEHLSQWLIQYNSISGIRKTISHGKLHHRNVLVKNGGEIVILDFEHAGIDTPVRDLAYFIRHYILNKEHRIWAQEWVATYQKNVLLLVPEKKLLAIYLLFPERLISLAKSYEKNDRNWSDDVYLKKLQVRWSQMKELLWFIDQNQWLND